MTTEPTPLDLPDYHGRKPVGMKTSVNGAGNRIQREHAIGDRVVLVVEAKVKKAGHEDTDDGLLYTETLKVVDLFEVSEDSKAASRLLAAMRQATRTQADAGKRTPIEGADGTDEADMGAVGYTDASGVVLTPAELAELRGDPVTALLGNPVRVVVVFTDNHRTVWPDEFEPGTLRPIVGETVLVDDMPRVVEVVLDAETGEPIGSMPVPFDDGPFPGDDADDVILDDDQDADGEPAPAPAVQATTLEALDPDDAPTLPDFEFVDEALTALRDNLEDVIDAAHLRRIFNAERQGRGRGLAARSGALKAIEARYAVVSTSVILKKGGQ